MLPYAGMQGLEVPELKLPSLELAIYGEGHKPPLLKMPNLMDNQTHSVGQVLIRLYDIGTEHDTLPGPPLCPGRLTSEGKLDAMLSQVAHAVQAGSPGELQTAQQLRRPIGALHFARLRLAQCAVPKLDEEGDQRLCSRSGH